MKLGALAEDDALACRGEAADLGAVFATEVFAFLLETGVLVGVFLVFMATHKLQARFVPSALEDSEV